MSDRVVNILFHGIGEPRRELEPGEQKYWISESAFHDILDETLSWPGVRLSFDDSNASDLELALPALLARGTTATFFVIAGRVDAPGSLTADGIRTLRDNGMRIGTHGMWHRPWRRLTAEQRAEEWVTARDRIAELVGSAVDEAGLPLGQYERTTLSALRRLGYARVFTSDRSVARSDAWLQARYSVYAGDSGASMRSHVFGQSALRRVRGVGVGLVKRWR
jgi:peptidoglycan/xylan/chitin deacetylase (PgdA/CDA1 family)